MKKMIFLFIFISSLGHSFPKFSSNFDQWKNKEHHFLEYIDDKDQVRAVFIGSKVYSADNKGKRPSVSEGQGYGLLLSYANDDQHLFDKFLRYILEACSKYGCVRYGKTKCEHRSYFLMPWMLDENNEPFLYMPQKDSKESYISTGSATDADIQIAWAIYLAMKKVEKGEWKNHFFRTYFGKADYKTLFHEMVNEIRLYDIEHEKVVINPGSQWGENGKNVFFAGYFTPQAFRALDKVPMPNENYFPPDEEKNSEAYLITIKNNSTEKLFVRFDKADGKVFPNHQIVDEEKDLYSIPPLCVAKIYFFPKKHRSNIFIKTYVTQKEKDKAEFNFITLNKSFKIENTNDAKYRFFTKKDRAYLSFTSDDFSKLKFTFDEVMINSAKVIKNFQDKNNTGFMPNIYYFDGNYPKPGKWEKTFSYDAIRYILWTTPFVYHNPNHKYTSLFKNILDRMYNQIKPYIEKKKNGWALPAEGVNAFTGKVNKGWEGISPSLNAPLFIYAYYFKDKEVFEKLGPNILNYSIVNKQPSIFDPPNDSSAYYTAIMLLVMQALMEGNLD